MIPQDIVICGLLAVEALLVVGLFLVLGGTQRDYQKRMRDLQDESKAYWDRRKRGGRD